jgi:hypothetical protein
LPSTSCRVAWIGATSPIFNICPTIAFPLRATSVRGRDPSNANRVDRAFGRAIQHFGNVVAAVPRRFCEQ